MPSPFVARALKRAGVRAVAAAAAEHKAGGSTLDVSKAAMKGAVPIAAPLVDKVVTQQNVDRVRTGVRDVIDKGRDVTFRVASNITPPPPPPPPRSN